MAYHTQFEVLVQSGMDPRNRHACECVPDLDPYTTLVQQNGDLYVYRCTDISVAQELISYLDGTLVRPFVVGNPRIAMVQN